MLKPVVFFDWGGTLMQELGPDEVPMRDWPQVAAVDGAAALLAALAPKFRLAVASNASLSDGAQIRTELARVALDGYFTHIFCRRELGVGKEDPRFWQLALAAMAVDSTHACMVGDSLRADVQAAQACGLYALWLAPDGATPPGGVTRVARLFDALPLLAAWRRGLAHDAG